MPESCSGARQGNLYPFILVIPPVAGRDDQNERAEKKPSGMHTGAEISAVPPVSAGFGCTHDIQGLLLHRP